MDAIHASSPANLRLHRKRLGLSQEALAELCDLHRTEISLLERQQALAAPGDDRAASTRGLQLSSVCDLLESQA